ncbi:MAG TPA: PHB depolymerase family esterase [Armatimonadota bacterium]|jgi:dienelactone hydrolase
MSTHSLLLAIPLAVLSLSPARSGSVASARLQAGPLLSVGAVESIHGPLAPWDAVRERILRQPGYHPAAGDTLVLSEGKTAQWEPLTISADGWYTSDTLRDGYAYTSVTSSARTIAILSASAHAMAFVNGEPRIGDPYKDGFVRLPVLLHPGRNDLFLRSERGFLRCTVKPCAPSVMLDAADATLPDLRIGEPARTRGALVLINATEETLTGLTIESTVAGAAVRRMNVPAVGPLSVRKVAFAIVAPAPARAGEVGVRLRLLRRGMLLAKGAVRLRVRRPAETYKRTFVSDLDGSVQYYAVNPVQPPAGSPGGRALVLSLHGAGGLATSAADAYHGKTWASIVAPTNRRPIGYRWEDWGRMDALEVLAQGKQELKPDPRRIYLTGHSMGGHGTWLIGVLYPGLFAAIGPCSGYGSDFDAAKFAGGAGVDGITRRPNNTMDIKSLASNYADEGVYILHGDADETISVDEARHMANLLGGFHKDFRIHEQKGVGHWWDSSDEPGAECMDWPPLFDFLARHTLPTDDAVRQVRFATVNPSVSASCHWVTIEQQERLLLLSAVDLQVDPGQRRVIGTTANVARLALDLRMLSPGGAVRLGLDGETFGAKWPVGGVLRLAREQGHWRVAAPLPATQKNPRRNGPFREAIRRRTVLVYGTTGKAEENAWAYAKARYDAETFWVYGNGTMDVVPDTAYRAASYRDRGVVLYGNAESNAAWKGLLADSPVQVTRDGVSIGGRWVRGDDLACTFIRPRADSAIACVAVVAPTGRAGRALADGMGYLLPLTGFPDVLVASVGQGVVAAGLFGNDWSVLTGEFAWTADQTR